MSLGETPESTQTILEQKDLSDLTPAEQRREAQLFIINMHKFMTEQIRKFEERPEASFEFMDNMDDLKERAIESHNKINPLTRVVWDESNQQYDDQYGNVESLADKQVQTLLTPEAKQQLKERAEKRDELLRIREKIKDHLDADGLKAFNEAMEAEIDLINIF